MLRLTPWIQGRFVYFLVPRLLVMKWKNGERIFMKISCNYRHDTSNKYLDCFPPARLLHGLPSKRRSVSVSKIAVKGMSGFSWRSAMIQGTIWKKLGMIREILWIQDSFFEFSGYVCVTNITELRMDGYYWNFQDINTSSNWLDCFMLE